jgi:hypothetical protein
MKLISSIMMSSNKQNSLISRRGLLRLAILAGMLGAAGCNEGGSQTAAPPTQKGGNRKRLDRMKEKAEEVEGRKAKL